MEGRREPIGRRGRGVKEVREKERRPQAEVPESPFI
jgi:hypothetical protein